MSDFLTMPKLPSLPSPDVEMPWDMSPSELETWRFKKEAEEKVLKRKSNWQPLDLVFNVLSRGQFLTANLTEELIKASRGEKPNFADAVVGAITGRREGDYGEIIEEHGFLGRSGEEWARPIFGEQYQGKFLDNLSWADVLGFIGNVALDPTTYLGFGPTKGAMSVADDFARKKVQLVAKNLGVGDKALDVMKASGFQPTEFLRRFNDDIAEGLGYMNQHGGKSVANYLNSVVREAKRDAMNLAPEELQEQLLKLAQNIGEGWETTNDVIRNLGDFAQAAERGLHLLGKEVAPELFRTQGPGMLGRAGAKLSETVWGKPLDIVRGEAAMAKEMGDYAGSRFSNALWSFMNRGPIEDIRKKIGIRNGYEQILRAKELEASGEYLQQAMEDSSREWLRISETVPDDTKALVREGFERLEDLVAEGAKTEDGTIPKTLMEGLWTLQEDGQFMARMKEVYGENMYERASGEFKTFFEDLHQYLREMLVEERQWAARGFSQMINDRLWYLPTFQSKHGVKGMFGAKVKGTFTPPQSKARKFTRKQVQRQEAAKLTWIFDMNFDDAMNAVEKMKRSSYSFDLDELIVSRIEQHSKMAARVNMIEQFREFGIPIGDEITQELSAALNRNGGHISDLGLTTIEDKALEGLMFDESVAEILTRAIDVTGPKKGWFKRAMVSYMQWWKGVVTATTGFHARNHISNTVTGFLKQGPEWFNPEKTVDSVVATIYGLGKRDPKRMVAIAKKAGIGEGDFLKWSQARLKRKYGDFTLQELADWALEKGVISESVMGMGTEKTVAKFLGEDLATLNPFSKDNVFIRASHSIGNVVENTPRMKNFLMDYEDIYKARPVGMEDFFENKLIKNEYALNWAKNESKKWFLDYSDLTPFEQNVMKTVIPFYSWLRKNIGNQISGIVLYPEMYSLVPKLMETFEEDLPEGAILPDWMRQRGMFSVGEMDKERVKMFDPNLPFQDLNRIPLMFADTEAGIRIPKLRLGELRDDLLQATSPFIKDIIEVLPEVGYDLFYKRQVEGDRNAPTFIRLILSKPETLGFLDGFMRSIGIEEGVPFYIGRNNKLQMPAKWEKLLNNHMPILSRLEDLIVLGQLPDAWEEALSETANLESDYDKAERTFQVLSRFLGVKFKVLDLEKEEEYLDREIGREAKEMKDAYRRRNWR